MKLRSDISDAYREKISTSAAPGTRAYADANYELNLPRVLMGSHVLMSLQGKRFYDNKGYQASDRMECTIEIKNVMELPVQWSSSYDLKDNIYYTTTSRNLKSIDAFVISGNVAYLLQATVSPKHPVLLAGLMSVFFTLQKLRPELQTCELVFLTPDNITTNVLNKIQPLHGDDNKNLSDISSLDPRFQTLLTRQWVLLTPSLSIKQ